MRLSEKYHVPREVSLIYDFANSLNKRRFVEQGVTHEEGDDFAAPAQLEAWMRRHDLLAKRQKLCKDDHGLALALRAALRAFVQEPVARRGRSQAANLLTRICTAFPLVLNANGSIPRLQPAPASSTLGSIVAELYALAQADKLDRLKMCASDDCQWVFYDRSRPGTRRWCSSALCGNRQKTRAYRERQASAKGST